MDTEQAYELSLDRFADHTDLETVEGVAIRVYLFEDGSILEVREDRSNQTDFSKKLFGPTSTVACCYRKIIAKNRY